MPFFLLLVFSVVLTISCGPTRGEDPLGASLSNDGAPRVSLLDSTILAEPESLALGMYVHIALDGMGRVYLSDVAMGRILRFSAGGGFERSWGRRGSGPGEYRTVDMLHPLPGDSTAAVMDMSSGRLSVVSLNDGTILRSMNVPFGVVGKQWSFVNGTAIFSLPGSETLLGGWVLGEDSATVNGELPSDLSKAFAWYMHYGHLELVPWQDGYLAQVPALPGLQMLDTSGTIVGRVELPASRRRGQPGDLLSKQQQWAADGNPLKYFGSASATLGVLTTGEVVAVQVDIDAEPGATGPVFTNLKYYVSIVSSDLKRVCLDALVPFTSDAPFPIPHLMGDTLVALSRVVGMDDVVRTVVYRFGISSKGCTWVPL